MKRFIFVFPLINFDGQFEEKDYEELNVFMNLHSNSNASLEDVTDYDDSYSSIEHFAFCKCSSDRKTISFNREEVTKYFELKIAQIKSFTNTLIPYDFEVYKSPKIGAIIDLLKQNYDICFAFKSSTGVALFSLDEFLGSFCSYKDKTFEILKVYVQEKEECI